jgi:hypothetical protein
MNCPTCNTYNSDAATICTKCGADLAKPAAGGDAVGEFVEKAKAVGREAMDTDIAKDAVRLADAAIAKGRAALDTPLGHKVSDLAGGAADAGKSALATKRGKEVAVGAALGAVIAIPLPFVGPIVGAAIGAGIAWIRNASKAK